MYKRQKSSCPSPERYLEAYTCEAENVYAVTLSAELSGSYNSAELGKKLYKEEKGEKNIYVFNSRSASIGETLIALKIEECEKEGLGFQQVIEKVEAYIVDYIADGVKNPEEKVLAISHCNCPARAEMVKEEILKRIHVKDVLVLDTAGVSSLYASDGGVFVVV